MAFLNGDQNKKVHIKQPRGYISERNDCLVFRLHGQKHASCQWHLKFHNVIYSCGSIKNIMGQCINNKVNGSKIIFLVLYVDEIL